MMNVINFIILFGAVQGLVLSLILFSDKKNIRSGRFFLGIFILILAYNGFETYNLSAGLNYDFFYYTSFILVFGIGPSIYWYIKSFTNPEQIRFSIVVKHYLPVFIQFFIKTVLVLYLFSGKNREFGWQIGSVHAIVSEPLSVIFASVYIWRAWIAFYKLRQEEKTHLSAEEKVLIIKWLQIFFVFLGLLMVMWTVSVLAQYFFTGYTSFSFYYPTEVLLVILIYWVGFTGFQHIRVVHIAINKPSIVLNDYSEKEINDCILALQEAMKTDKYYLDPELSLTKLSNHLNIPSKTISAVLNQQLKKGFNEFVNEYRIEEVKQKLLKPENQYLTISGIALESGFNSQATFQRVFKAQTYKTPKEFLASQRQNVEN